MVCRPLCMKIVSDIYQRFTQGNFLVQIDIRRRTWQVHLEPWRKVPAVDRSSLTDPVQSHPTPYTLDPRPFTLHPTPFTLHPTPSCPREPESRTLKTSSDSPPRIRRGPTNLVEESPQGRLAPCLRPHRRGCNPPPRSAPPIIFHRRVWFNTAGCTGISRMNRK